MSSNICNICGANYQYKDGKWVCPACGAYKPEELSNEEVTLLYNAGQQLRLCVFDTAEEMYRDIARKFPKNSEGYWGLVLAKYGIKYEEDYDGKMLPSCYATSYESILDDKDYKRALDLASLENKKYYTQQAQKIEKIRKEWVEKAQREQPYDIFISYKDTEPENGVERTRDSFETYELYTHLREKGYNVFYSRESLKDKTGEKYEPYIFNALNTAHVMIVFASKPEYIESTWVRNEWLRYYKRIEAKQKQQASLAVVYHGFNPSKLPKPLPKLQHINCESITWLQTLDAYVERVIKASKQNVPRIERTEIRARTEKRNKGTAKLSEVEVTEIKGATASAVKREAIQTREIGVYSVPKLNANAEKLLSIAQRYLESRNFVDAEKTFDSFLVNNPQNGDALLGKMFAQAQCNSIEEFAQTGVIGFDNFQLLNDVLAYSEKFVAERLLTIICCEITRLFNANEFVKAQGLYGQICSVDSPDVQSMRESLYHKSLSILKNDEAKYFVDTALLYEQDGDVYTKKLHEVFESCIKAGVFSLAQEYEQKLLECDKTNLHTQIGRLQLKYQAENLDKVLDYCETHDAYTEAEEVLHCVDEEGANRLLVAFANKCGTAVQAGKYHFALSWYRIFSKYRFKQREYFLQSIVNLCTLNPNEDGSKLFEEVATALSGGNADTYAEFYYNLAESAREKGLFSLAISCYEIAIEYGEDDLPDYTGKFYAEIQCDSGQKISKCIANLQSYETLEYILVLLDDDKRRIDFLSNLIAACIAHVRNAQSDKEQVYTVFEKLLSYIPESYDEKVLSFVNEMAKLCLAQGFFEKAERYYAMSVGIDSDDHIVYWGLLHAKLKCRTEEELIKQPEIISEFQEFQNALFASAMNEEASRHYIDVQNKQKAWIAEQEQKRIRAKKRKKIVAIASVALSGMIAVGGAAAGVALWFDSENQLKYEEVQGGYAVDSGRFYHKNASGVFEIPARYNGKPIVEIKANAFKDFDNVTEFVIPYSVTKISDNAFADCDNLQTVSFAASQVRAISASKLQEIGVRAFYDCKNLSELSLPYGLTTIGDEAFANTAFTRLDIPNTVEYIGANAFAYTTELTLITVADRNELPVTWHADWNKNCSAEVAFSFRIQLTANGGTLSQTEQYVIYDKDFNLPVPTRNGYTFAGWYSDGIKLTDANGHSVNAWTFPNGGTVAAEWKANENKIVFDGNGATGGGMSAQTVKTDASAILSQNTFTKVGYTFAGWATSADGRVVYTDKATYKMGTDSSYTLYAVWELHDYSITYNLNGGTVSGNPAQYNFETNTFTLANPTRAGYTFAGWTGTGLSSATKDVTVSKGSVGDREYIAIYKANDYLITFDSNGGKCDIEQLTVQCDSDVILPTPICFAYDFLGWYYGDTLYEDGAWLHAGDITLTAKWQRQEIISISTAEELAMVAQELSSDFILNNDIDLGGAEWTSLEYFKGMFNGNNHTVSNFRISVTTEHAGFFGVNDGIIQNLHIAEVNITSGSSSAGMLVGVNFGTILNCSAVGTVDSSANDVGGLVGLAVSRTGVSNRIELCSAKGNISATGNYIARDNDSDVRVGGLIGRIEASPNNTILICKSYADTNIVVTATDSNYANAYSPTATIGISVGGLIGENNYMVCSQCYSIGTITASVTMQLTVSTVCDGVGNSIAYIGGFSGSSTQSYLSNSYSNMRITAESNSQAKAYYQDLFYYGKAAAYMIVGGFLGNCNDCTVENSCSISTIKATSSSTTKNDASTSSGLYYSYIGGFIGVDFYMKTKAKNCFGYVSDKMIKPGLGSGVGYQRYYGGFYGGIGKVKLPLESFSKEDNIISVTNSYRCLNDECNVTVGTPTVLTDFKSVEFIKNTLGWDDTIWTLVNGEFPKLKLEKGEE